MINSSFSNPGSWSDGNDQTTMTMNASTVELFICSAARFENRGCGLWQLAKQKLVERPGSPGGSPGL